MSTEDFALLRPLPVLRDEDGTYHCPAPLWKREWTNGGDDFTTTVALCGEDLEVRWTLSCPVPDHDSVQHMIHPDDAMDWANWSSWELRCCNGHVLLTSADGDSFDNATQPFDSRRVFGD